MRAAHPCRVTAGGGSTPQHTCTRTAGVGVGSERVTRREPWLDEFSSGKCALSRNPALLPQENKFTAEGACVRRTPVEQCRVGGTCKKCEKCLCV